MISIDYTLIVVILNFALLLVVLNALLYKPIKKFLIERQDKIAFEMKEAEEAKIVAAELAAKQEEEFKASLREIQKMKEISLKEAEKTSDEIIKQAREHEKAVLADTEKKLEFEKRKAIQEIESELGDAIASIAYKIVGKHIDEAIDAELIDKLIKEERGIE